MFLFINNKYAHDLRTVLRCVFSPLRLRHVCPSPVVKKLLFLDKYMTWWFGSDEARGLSSLGSIHPYVD